MYQKSQIRILYEFIQVYDVAESDFVFVSLLLSGSDVSLKKSEFLRIAITCLISRCKKERLHTSSIAVFKISRCYFSGKIITPKKLAGYQVTVKSVTLNSNSSYPNPCFSKNQPIK